MRSARDAGVEGSFVLTFGDTDPLTAHYLRHSPFGSERESFGSEHALNVARTYRFYLQSHSDGDWLAFNFGRRIGMGAGIMSFGRDLKWATRSLGRTKGLSLAVVLTLALGIGANAAMFTLLRGVLLRPLVNRDEGRLVYIRQNADGKNAWFSVPEINDLTSRVKTLNSFGDFSIIGFTLVGLGEARTVQAGVVG